MTLQRRLIFAILIAAPIAWLVTIAATYWRAEHEINELYDTDMARMAQQIYAMLPMFSDTQTPAQPPHTEMFAGDQGDAGFGDVALSAWLPDGRALQIDADGDRLPKNDGVQGFKNITFDGAPWRAYYLQSVDGGWRVAVGQRLGERNDLVYSYLVGQIVPWLLGLPILLLLLIWAVRQALQPVRQLSNDIERRSPEDRTPLNPLAVPGELRQLVEAMNRLLGKVAAAIEYERRLTADAAHELRTPLAALRAQWEVAQRSLDDREKCQAHANIEIGFDRLGRLVSQLLEMARLENSTQSAFREDVSWQRVMTQAVSDCLALSQRRNVDVEVIWPAHGFIPLPVSGDENLLTLLLRNLLDNAIRYGDEGTTVTVSFETTRIVVLNQGPGVPQEQLSRLGDRFFRMAGQHEEGSGLGLSISRRVAQVHGLSLDFENIHGSDGTLRFTATIQRSHIAT